MRARAPQIGERRRFVEGLGAEAVMETGGGRYRELGLGYMRLEPVDVLERLRDDPGLLRLPLVRFGNELAAGVDEQRWRTIVTAVSTVSGGSSEQNR
ncbi:MAG: arsenate reductase family protein [Candidatus Limnocylindrales bacterium]